MKAICVDYQKKKSSEFSQVRLNLDYYALNLKFEIFIFHLLVFKHLLGPYLRLRQVSMEKLL